MEKLTTGDLKNTDLLVERVKPKIHRTSQRQRYSETNKKHRST